MGPMGYRALAVFAGRKRQSDLATASHTCSVKLRKGAIDDFARCVSKQMSSNPSPQEKNMAKRKHHRKSPRRGSKRRYAKYRHAVKRLQRRRSKMKIGAASKYCSIKNGYTTKTARKDCMSRRMKGHFAGRRIHHRRKHG